MSSLPNSGVRVGVRAAQLLDLRVVPHGAWGRGGEECRLLLMGLGRPMGPSGSTDIDRPWAAETGQFDPPAKGPSRRLHRLLQGAEGGATPGFRS